MLFLVHGKAGYVEHVSLIDRQVPYPQSLIKHRPALIVGNFLPITEATPGPTSSS
jgi:hypothetical protein